MREEEAHTAAGRASGVAAEMFAEGLPVRFVSSVFVPGDELLLTTLEAPLEALVDRLARRAGLPVDRLSECVVLEFPAQASAGS